MAENVGQDCVPTVQMMIQTAVKRNVWSQIFPFLPSRDVDIKSLKKQTVQFQQFQKFRRKERNTLKTDYDEHGRPMQKIALLCGPPGLGMVLVVSKLFSIDLFQIASFLKERPRLLTQLHGTLVTTLSK